MTKHPKITVVPFFQLNGKLEAIRGFALISINRKRSKNFWDIVSGKEPKYGNFSAIWSNFWLLLRMDFLQKRTFSIQNSTNLPGSDEFRYFFPTSPKMSGHSTILIKANKLKPGKNIRRVNPVINTNLFAIYG